MVIRTAKSATTVPYIETILLMAYKNIELEISSNISELRLERQICVPTYCWLFTPGLTCLISRAGLHFLPTPKELSEKRLSRASCQFLQTLALNLNQSSRSLHSCSPST